MKKIFIVDDTPQMLRLVSRMVRDLDGVEVLTAANGRDAIKVCEYHERTKRCLDHRPVANSNIAGLYAVVSDFDLGIGPDGTRVLATAPVGAIRVLMSGDLPVDCRPADHILSKPFTREELLLALNLEE